jgi:hypothetical protein
MNRETAGESALELAAKRLERALAALEHRSPHAGAESEGGLFDRGQGAAQLAAELEQAKARQRELEAAGAEASAALGRAIREIRTALNDQASGTER